MPKWTVPAVAATATETQILALTLWAEARAEPRDGLEAVAAVIHRRRQLKRWGPTYRQVCLAPWQFSCWTPLGGRRNHAFLLSTLQRVMNAPSLDKLDKKVVECLELASSMLAGTFSPPLVADHYCTVDLLHTRPPAWTRDRAPVAIIGHHAFFNLAPDPPRPPVV